MQIVTCWTPLNAEGRREEKVRPSGPSEARKPKSKKLQHIERPRARYVLYCVRLHIVATIAVTHTVTQPFLTPNITHPSPAALCAILPTLRENKGLLVSLCCTSGEDRTGTRLMLSLPASKPQSPHKGSLGISLREDHTETRLMLSLPAAKPHSPHKRSLGIILREEKARLMLSLPVCKSRSPPKRPLGLISWVKTTQKHV